MAGQASEIRVVKKISGHAAHHGGAWKVAYADFVTAMMAFFLVMWIVGLSSEVKEAVAGYFKDPVAFAAAVKKAKAGNSAFSITEAVTGGKDNKPGGETIAAEKDALTSAMKSIENIIANSPEFKKLKEFIDIQLVPEGLKIELLEAKESLFFDSGCAKIKPATAHLLAVIAQEINSMKNKIIIEGHTDSRPLARTDGYTNWELSADRANAARRVMTDGNLSPDHIAQVRGYAATRPRDPKHPEHFTNRRVSIIVMFSNAMKTEENSHSSGAKSDAKPDLASDGIKLNIMPDLAKEKTEIDNKSGHSSENKEKTSETKKVDVKPIGENVFEVPKGWKIKK